MASLAIYLPVAFLMVLHASAVFGSFLVRNSDYTDNSSSEANEVAAEIEAAHQVERSAYEASQQGMYITCGGGFKVVANSKGSLVYPYSGLYADNLECQWTIEAPEGMVIELTVGRLAIQDSRDCGRDRLELFELSPLSVASSLSGRLCGYRNSLNGNRGDRRQVMAYTSGQRMVLVRFLTDDTVGDTGFLLEYRPIAMVTSQEAGTGDENAGHRNQLITASDRIVLHKDTGNALPAAECPSIAIMTAKSGVIKYPRTDGDRYQNNAQCSWLITTPPGNIIRLTIVRLDIEARPNCRIRCCQMDSLTVFNGPNNRSMAALELCGTEAPNGATHTRTNQALVQFASNGKTVGRGFELHYERIERGGPSAKLCSADIEALPRSDAGVLESPGFNETLQKYPHGANCRWRIVVSSGKRIQLRFRQFSIEETVNCTADSVRVFDGSDETKPLLIDRRCGQQLPEVVTTSGHIAVVSLTSDASVSEGGFSISWTAVSRTSSEHGSKNCDTSGCGGETLELEVDKLTEKTLHSPNFGTGDNYPNDAWCSWLITAPPNTNVFLRFESFNVESPYSGTTCYDALTVYDGSDDEADIIGTFCGESIPPDVLASSYQLFVTFQSDSSSQAPGFLAHYSAKEGTGDVDGRNCGVPDVQPNIYNRIVGGDESAAHSWPWQVSLQYSQRGWQHWCGGSILAPNWIITAAHCFVNFGGETDFRVVVGEHNRDVNEGTERLIGVSHVIIHESYNKSNTDNDIALLKLVRNVTFNRNVKPICLPRDDVEENTMCITTGWGDTRGTGNSSVLNQLHVPVLSRSICNQRGWYSGRMTDNMMCAGYPEGRRDSCQGDSGGPLVCLDDGRWRLYGLTSWGENCAASHKPGIYTRTVRYLDWIQRKTGGQNCVPCVVKRDIFNQGIYASYSSQTELHVQHRARASF